MYLYIFLGIFLVFLFLYINSNVIQISNYKVKSSKIPKGFNGYRIVQLSDLHNKKFGINNEVLVKKVEKLKPDIVIMSGDMVQKYIGNFDIAESLVRTLSKKYIVYYSLGNHELEYPYSILKQLTNKMIKAGAIILKDESLEIENKGSKIMLYGLNFKYNMKKEVKNKDYVKGLNNLIGKASKDKYNILIAHDPLNFKVYEKWGADLVFSGHVHGGIIRLFGVGILSPRRTFFPKYTSGEYRINESKMIVSRGLGNSRVGVRVFNLPHINFVTLISEE